MDITTLLQWLIPSGGLGAVLVWLTNKTLRNLKTAKEIHDTYKFLYEDVSATLITLQDENNKLRENGSRNSRALARAASCKYYTICPINIELLYNQTTDVAKQSSKGQYRNKGNTGDSACDNPTIEGADSDTGDRPP